MSVSTQIDPFRTFLKERWISQANQFEGQIQGRFNRLFRASKLIHRISYMAMHLFRTSAMIGLASLLPFSTPINVTVCIVGTVVYRFTAEPPCTMRYALSALEGQFAWYCAGWGVARLASETAHRTLQGQLLTAVAFVPAFAWAAGVIQLAFSLNPPMCCHRK